MSNQPQASVHKGATRTCLRPPLPTSSTPQREGPREPSLSRLCVPATRGVPSARHPAPHPREGTCTQAEASGRRADLPFLLLFASSLFGGSLFHPDDRAHLPGLHSDTMPRARSLRLRWPCRTKSELGSWRLKCSSYGADVDSWVLCMNVLWETSKEHHSQFGIFKECSGPPKGTSLESVLAFIQTLCSLGKLIEVRKRSGKDQKAKTPAKKKPGEKKFF